MTGSVAKFVAMVAAAVRLAESEGYTEANVPAGDGGAAVGVFQMHEIAVREANRIVGFECWSPADRQSAQQSWAMCMVTLTYHYLRGVTDPVALGGKWKAPFSECPEEYLAKVRRNLKLETGNSGEK